MLCKRRSLNSNADADAEISVWPYSFFFWDITEEFHEMFVFILVGVIDFANVSPLYLAIIFHFDVIIFYVNIFHSFQ